ncbi:MAG TPA: AI-2E family transporter, partial [Hyphomicrobium sp.]|nr:AI-2E family transporter [Hyphomicrobium sp.]
QAALTFLFTLFLLMQYKDLRDRVVRVFGTDNMTETTAAMSDAGERLSALFIGQVILNASFGIFVGCALLIIGVPNAPLWGVVAFVMRFVPFIGSYVAAIPPILLAAAVDPGWTKTLWTLAVFVIAEPIMGQVIEPFFLGKRAGLSPFAMIIAASFWTLLWGPLGLVLAAPLTLVLVVLGKYIPNLEFVSVLLGDEPPLSEQHEFYHRLLSGDSFEAVDQIEEESEDSSSEAVLDRLVFPALSLAVTDRRRGRLDSEAIKELEETIEEVSSKAFPVSDVERAPVLVIPVRGTFDIVAARFAIGAINAKAPGAARAILSSSGLTALSSVDQDSEAPPVRVVFVTIVGIAEKTSAFLARRAAEKFSGAQIWKLDLTKSSGSLSDGLQADDKSQTFTRLTDLMIALTGTIGSLSQDSSPVQAEASAEYRPALTQTS